MNTPDTREFQSRMEQIDAMLQESDEQADPASAARLQEVTASLLALHRVALERIMTHLAGGGVSCAAMNDAFLQDEMVSGLLILHGLHPLDLEARVRAGLKKAEPYLASHGGHVELVSISEEGAVNLRLEGSCHGCAGSRVTLRSTIEQEIFAAAPEVTSVNVEGIVEADAPKPIAGFIPLDHLSINGISVHLAAT